MATDACLTADPGVTSSIPAESNTFLEIDHEIISTVILLPSAESVKKVFVSYKQKSTDSSFLWSGISHAREPLYSNSAVIAWCSQSSGAQNILFWFTVIHSISQYFTAFNFHDIFFIWNYCLGIVVHSGPIRAF